MSARSANDLSVAELKKKLKVLGRVCTGTRNELIIRLNETSSSGVWTEDLSETQKIRNIEVASLATSESAHAC